MFSYYSSVLNLPGYTLVVYSPLVLYLERTFCNCVQIKTVIVYIDYSIVNQCVANSMQMVRLAMSNST